MRYVIPFLFLVMAQAPLPTEEPLPNYLTEARPHALAPTVLEPPEQSPDERLVLHREHMKATFARQHEDQTARPNDPLPTQCHGLGGIWRDAENVCLFLNPEYRVLPFCNDGKTASLVKRATGRVGFECN